MKKILIMSTIVLATASTSSFAASNDKTLPNGQPFQNLQEQVDVTNAAIEATNEAQAASVKALEAADAALKARDDLLQGQIDMINMTLSDQLSLIDSRFRQLESDIALVAKNSEDADILINEKIELMQLAIDTLSGRADAVDALNAWQGELIQALADRANSIEQDTAAHKLEAIHRFQDLANQIDNALSRANAAFDLASDDYQYNALASRLTAVENVINTLNNSLGDLCNYGYYVVGVTSGGDLKCREITDLVSVTQTLTKYRYCVTSTGGDPGDFFYVCWDYKYYQYGTAYCPYDYSRSSTSVSAPGGINTLNHYTTSAYLRTFTTDSESSTTGSITVRCSRNVDEYVSSPGY